MVSVCVCVRVLDVSRCIWSCLHQSYGSAYPGSPEGLVDGPEPAHIRAGGEHEEPDDRQSEVRYAAAAEHPHEAANQIHHKGSGINWKHMCRISDSG